MHLEASLCRHSLRAHYKITRRLRSNADYAAYTKTILTQNSIDILRFLGLLQGVTCRP